MWKTIVGEFFVVFVVWKCEWSKGKTELIVNLYIERERECHVDKDTILSLYYTYDFVLKPSKVRFSSKQIDSRLL